MRLVGQIRGHSSALYDRYIKVYSIGTIVPFELTPRPVSLTLPSDEVESKQKREFLSQHR